MLMHSIRVARHSTLAASSPSLHSSVLLSRSLHHRRSFFSFPSSSAPPPLVINTSRILPYSRPALFSLISDISSYPTFIPFCSGAEVHSLSNPEAETGKRWPASATLHVGFSGYSESYLSRVYCVPHRAVEAVSGAQASSSLDRSQLDHYNGIKFSSSDDSTELFSSLRARWTLDNAGGKSRDGTPDSPSRSEQTNVSLAIEAHWKNGLLASMSKEFAPSVAGKIIEAFEKRAREVLG